MQCTQERMCCFWVQTAALAQVFLQQLGKKGALSAQAELGNSWMEEWGCAFSSEVLRTTSFSIYISPLPNIRQNTLIAKVGNFIQCHGFRRRVAVKSIEMKSKPRLICLVGVKERYVLGRCSLHCLMKSCVLLMRRNAKAMNGVSVTVWHFERLCSKAHLRIS